MLSHLIALCIIEETVKLNNENISIKYDGIKNISVSKSFTNNLLHCNVTLKSRLRKMYDYGMRALSDVDLNTCMVSEPLSCLAASIISGIGIIYVFLTNQKRDVHQIFC